MTFILNSHRITQHCRFPRTHKTDSELQLCCNQKKTKDPSYFLAPAVLPGDPFHSVSGIAEAITTGKLLAVPVSMATLGTNQSQEVEFVQVYLQETENTLITTHVNQ